MDSGKGGERRPRKEFGDVLNFGVRLEHHEVMVCDDEVDVRHCLSDLLRNVALLVFYLHVDLVLLLASKDAAVSIGQPYQHVVVETQMEPADGPNLIRIFGLVLLECFLDKVRDLLYQLIQVHRWLPLILSGRKHMCQQVSPVCK